MLKLKLAHFHLLIFAILATGLLSPALARAALISVTGHGKAVLKFEDSEKVQVGSKFDVLGTDGKNKGAIEVTLVKGHSARGTITSGEASVGDKASLQSTDSAKAADAAMPPPAIPHVVFKKIIAAVSIDSETVQLTSATQVTMSGVSPIARFSYNGNLDDSGKTALKNFTWELGAGAEELKVTGNLASAACQGSSSCVFDIPSLTAIGRVGWRPFEQRHGAPELRLGADLLFPVSVNSNVISYSAFTPLFFATVGIAARYGRSEKKAIPFGFDFASYVGNSGTTLYRFILYAGYSWR